MPWIGNLWYWSEDADGPRGGLPRDWWRPASSCMAIVREAPLPVEVTQADGAAEVVLKGDYVPQLAPCPAVDALLDDGIANARNPLHFDSVAGRRNSVSGGQTGTGFSRKLQLVLVVNLAFGVLGLFIFHRFEDWTTQH